MSAVCLQLDCLLEWCRGLMQRVGLLSPRSERERERERERISGNGTHVCGLCYLHTRVNWWPVLTNFPLEPVLLPWAVSHGWISRNERSMLCWTAQWSRTIGNVGNRLCAHDTHLRGPFRVELKGCTHTGRSTGGGPRRILAQDVDIMVGDQMLSRGGMHQVA